jgi:2',3'-cyclic-nucleotide 2'-phosphodiesterase (5'-nucleotidase family)
MKKILLILLVFLLVSCRHQWIVSDIKASVVKIDSTKNAIADKELPAFYQPYKDSIVRQTSVVIGRAAKTLTMDKAAHENPLANFVSDAMRTRAEELMAPQTIDFALVNFGGIRTSLPEGDITIGNIYEISPFENALVILALKGSDLRELADVFAASGGQGVSGMTFGIQDGKAVNVLINGNPIDDSREYTIATVDYLALGGDKMLPLLRARLLLNPTIKLRDLLIGAIKDATQRGEMIDANLEGRVYKIQ